jgi:hypothetical protein
MLIEDQHQIVDTQALAIIEDEQMKAQQEMTFEQMKNNEE